MGRERGKSGAGDQKAQVTMYSGNRLQRYNVQHKNYSQYFTITMNGV